MQYINIPLNRYGYPMNPARRMSIGIALLNMSYKPGRAHPYKPFKQIRSK